MSSILEINENEYLIKLNRKRFNLSFVRSLLKMVEVSNHVDEYEVAERSVATNAQGQSRNTAEPDYFGSLEEK
ncbi:hypothetical protein C8P68_105317 [Mucilaginibacter yixingensis]|uniref:Uncharacterized protein n=1 Tax=Mucilaginibacter yixingensis TaxID=1295612 RepID=A0A2T5J8M3_9SPHI|nr:hypothetical protein [Mucilaginibacter yixingensis]PTQ95807.1 hypothetical protein C8P68_105317 [Mucilaginibacter yixingensis]